MKTATSIWQFARYVSLPTILIAVTIQAGGFQASDRSRARSSTIGPLSLEKTSGGRSEIREPFRWGFGVQVDRVSYEVGGSANAMVILWNHTTTDMQRDMPSCCYTECLALWRITNEDDVVVARLEPYCPAAGSTVYLDAGTFRFLPFNVPLEYLDSDTSDEGPLPPGDYLLHVDWFGSSIVNPSASIDFEIRE